MNKLSNEDLPANADPQSTDDHKIHNANGEFSTVYSFRSDEIVAKRIHLTEVNIFSYKTHKHFFESNLSIGSSMKFFRYFFL